MRLPPPPPVGTALTHHQQPLLAAVQAGTSVSWSLKGATPLARLLTGLRTAPLRRYTVPFALGSGSVGLFVFVLKICHHVHFRPHLQHVAVPEAGSRTQG